MKTTCPKCSSEDTQAVSALRPSDRGRFRQASRPDANRAALILGVLLLLGAFPMMFPVAAFMGLNIASVVLLAMLAAGVFLIVAYFASKRGVPDLQAKWDERNRYLREAWFCHRCGADWDGRA